MPFITTIVTLITNVNSVTTTIFYKNGGVKFEDLVTNYWKNKSDVPLLLFTSIICYKNNDMTC